MSFPGVSPACWSLDAASFCRNPATTGTAGIESCPNGAFPMAANAIVTPHANTSEGAPAGEPASCSDEMYAGVPMIWLVAVAVVSASRAMPKSMTRGPSGPISTFPGLKSRCTMPAWWRAVRAVAVPIASRSSALPMTGPSIATLSAKEGPSMNSLIKYG
nr:hypothetical protein [Nonomuraea aurantiaca]